MAGINILYTEILTHSILASLGAGIVSVDKTGTITYVNPYAERMVRMSVAELAGKVENQLPIVITGNRESLFKSALLGKTIPLPAQAFISVKSDKIPLKGTIAPLEDSSGSICGAVLVFYDATPELAEMSDQAAFYSTAAHELRTPLAIIKSSLSLVLENLETAANENQKELLKSAFDSVMQLTDLVNDFLSVARMEQGRLDVKKEIFDISSIVTAVVDEHKGLAAEKGLYMTYDMTDPDLPKVIADKTKVKEVLTNLLSNSIKYTLQGGVTIRHDIEGIMVMTLVNDTGIGITTDNQRLLFKKFQQVGAARTQSQNKSTGLGLFIARKLAEAMGGSVKLVASVPGQGASFALLLPMAP